MVSRMKNMFSFTARTLRAMVSLRRKYAFLLQDPKMCLLSYIRNNNKIYLFIMNFFYFMNRRRQSYFLTEGLFLVNLISLSSFLASLLLDLKRTLRLIGGRCMSTSAWCPLENAFVCLRAHARKYSGAAKTHTAEQHGSPQRGSRGRSHNQGSAVACDLLLAS